MNSSTIPDCLDDSRCGRFLVTDDSRCGRFLVTGDSRCGRFLVTAYFPMLPKNIHGYNHKKFHNFPKSMLSMVKIELQYRTYTVLVFHTAAPTA